MKLTRDTSKTPPKTQDEMPSFKEMTRSVSNKIFEMIHSPKGLEGMDPMMLDALSQFNQAWKNQLIERNQIINILGKFYDAKEITEEQKRLLLPE